MASSAKAWIFTAILAVTVGCGGGGGGSDTPSNPQATTVSGTAATGAAISNTNVAIKDRNGNTKTTTTDANGKYSIDVTGMTGPFLLKVYDNTNALYGVATAAGTANIHQFTDLIIRNWYKVQGSSVETAFNSSGAISVPTVTEINTIEATVRQIISAWLQSAGLDPDSFNLISSSFDANGSGFDGVLDVLKVRTTSGNVTITPVDLNTGTEGDPIATMPESSDLSSTSNPLSDAVNGVSSTLSNFANIVNTKGQSLTGSDVIGLVDTNYLHEGTQGQAAGAEDVAGNAFGATFNSLAVNYVISFDSVNSVITVMCTSSGTMGGNQFSNEEVWGDGMSFKKGNDGVWRFYGDQRIAEIDVEAGVRKWIDSSGTSRIEYILPISVDAPQGTVTAVSVSGSGLSSNPSNLIDGGYGSFYLSDNPISTAPAIGSVYTFTLTKAAGGTVTYKVTIWTTTTETFNIASPTAHTLTDAKLGNTLDVSWTLPTTFSSPIEAIELYGWVNNDHNCGADGTVSNTTSGTSGIITLPSSCNGSQVTKATIGVFIYGDNGEVSKVYHDFQ